MEDDMFQRQVRVCHKIGRIIGQNSTGDYNVAIQIGGVHQHLVVTDEYAQEHLVD